MSNFIESEHNGELFAEITPRKKAQLESNQLRRLFKSSNIPEENFDYTFSDYKGDKNFLNKIINYTNTFNKDSMHLYFYGKNSTQKTMIASCIAMELIRKREEQRNKLPKIERDKIGHFKCKFILAKEFVSLMNKEKLFATQQEFLSDIKELENLDLLILDDLFDEDKANGKLEIWDFILRSMTQKNVKTIITANVDYESLIPKYGLSIGKLVPRKFCQIIFKDDIGEFKKQEILNRFNKL